MKKIVFCLLMLLCVMFLSGCSWTKGLKWLDNLEWERDDRTVRAVDLYVVGPS